MGMEVCWERDVISLKWSACLFFYETLQLLYVVDIDGGLVHTVDVVVLVLAGVIRNDARHLETMAHRLAETCSHNLSIKINIKNRMC